MPTSVSTMPAKIIKIHALTKNNGPAAISLKNAPMTSSVELPAGVSSTRWAWQRFLARPSAADMTRASLLMITTRPAAGHGHTVRNRRALVTFPAPLHQGPPGPAPPASSRRGRLAASAAAQVTSGTDLLTIFLRPPNRL